MTGWAREKIQQLVRFGGDGGGEAQGGGRGRGSESSVGATKGWSDLAGDGGGGEQCGATKSAPVPSTELSP